MGVAMMTPSRQIQRQPAWFMLASEFGESTLNEKGSGEFDPTFVITKLGAKSQPRHRLGTCRAPRITRNEQRLTNVSGPVKRPFWPSLLLRWRICF